jgi:DNA helicase-2/ATP-dependent DNA helicase PcrA
VPELSEILSANRGIGYVVAPAGFGKTHLIAEAVSRTDRRQLVLTHTYAGVNQLRRKMRDLKVSSRCFRIDTIASWALRLSLSYPATSRWAIERPTGDDWCGLYRACSALLEFNFVRRILKASYSGLYVDEYQDCSIAQHDLVLKLARDLPCRLLGDPLQGIFDFNEEQLDWGRDIFSAVVSLGQMFTPHRWIRTGSPAIGTWLADVRRNLEAGQPVNLARDLPHGVTFKSADAQSLFRIQANACRYLRCGPDETAIAIHKGSQEYKAKCHVLARNLAGAFSSIEEIEGKALFSFVEKIEDARTNRAKLKGAVAFAKQCMTAVELNLPAATLRGEHTGISQSTRNKKAAEAANAYLAAPSSCNLAYFLSAVKCIDGVRITRADLFNRTMGVLRKHALRPHLTFIQAAEEYQAEFRHKGRPLGRRKLIGTTLLVKGLEFDHAIVLDAACLSKKELYVALTRGARSITIISTADVLHPVD